MTTADSHEHTPKAAGKKTGKANADTTMDDAPLFAGLDDFVLVRTAEKKKETPKIVKPREKSAAPAVPAVATEKPRQKKSPKTPKTPPDPDALLLSVADMCTLLNISRATLIRMDKAGKLPGRIKLGGSVRFHRATVETWLKNMMAVPSP